jgi:hypothetical protein
MLRFVEEFRRGWTDGRTGHADAARLPDGSGSDQEKTFAEVSALADQLNARVLELEAEVAEINELRAEITACTGVLRLPGVKTWLLSRFHPDKHPDANEEERRAFQESAQMINAAYEVAEWKT